MYDASHALILKHLLETPPIIAATKYPCYLVHKGHCVRAKAVHGERTPDWSLAPVHHRWGHGLVLHIREMADRSTVGARGLHDGSRAAESGERG